MASSPLKTDSPVARRIVRSFIDFLNSVEAAPDTDLEGLEVAKECLAEVFKLDSSCVEDSAKSDLLVDIFSSLESRGRDHPGIKSDHTHKETSASVSGSSSIQNASDATNLSDSSKCLGNDWSRESFAAGVSRDELFGQFFAALDKIHFFKTMPDGSDDTAQLDKATRLFHDAVTEMESSGCQVLNNKNNLAESLKSQGNRAMKSNLYPDAIELYTCAIALQEENAVYYCNRAAAYTQIHKYCEAVGDCLKSIQIDPNYSKAYSRLGLAYYAQGSYGDAIEKGFKKALQLDPNNETVKENIRVAELKLKEEQQQREQNQNSSSAGNTSSTGGPNQESHNPGGPRNHAGPFPFTSIPLDSNSLPSGFASMLMNMAANAYQGQRPQNDQGESNANPSGEPEIRLGGNVSVNFDQMPEELTGALRSMMGMFSGAAPGQNPNDAANGRPPSN